LENDDWHSHGTPLNLDNLFSLIDQAKELGGRVVVLAGEGEPSLHQEIQKIIEKINSAGMLNVVYSNGSLLTEELLNFYAENNTTLVISFDSFSPQLYLELTGNTDKNIFDRVIKNINLAREIYAKQIESKDDYKILRLAINATVSSLNKNEIANIKEFCADDIYFICNPLAKLGNAIGNWNEMLRSEEDYKEIKDIIKKLSETTGPLTLGSNGLCGYSINGISVSPSGNYMTCAYTSLTDGLLGNFADKSLREAYDYKQKQEQAFYNAYGHCPCLVRAPEFDRYLGKLKGGLL
jgi:MoaA/NifB/PqqE/SkfB family radical SAM enzyme